jgi:hypothetical protein
MENQAILKRLQDKTSNYDVGSWENDHRGRERILKNICEYPYSQSQRANFNPGMSQAQGFGTNPRPATNPGRKL